MLLSDLETPKSARWVLGLRPFKLLQNKGSSLCTGQCKASLWQMLSKRIYTYSWVVLMKILLGYIENFKRRWSTYLLIHHIRFNSFCFESVHSLLLENMSLTGRKNYSSVYQTFGNYSGYMMVSRSTRANNWEWNLFFIYEGDFLSIYLPPI